MTAAELAGRLTDLFGTSVDVGGLTALPGGSSRQTLRVPVSIGGARRDMVLRLEASEISDTSAAPRPGRAEAMAVEVRALAAAAAAGVPVPAVVDSGPSLGGRPYLLMEHVAGETIPRKLLRDDAFAGLRPQLAGQLGAVAARVHTIDGLPGLPHPEPVGELERISRDHDLPRPVVELGLRWLREHPVEPVPDTVVHGDLRNGNVIVGPDGIRAVLDWELVHRGCPVEDLGWLCVKAWRFGSALPVGGFGTREQLLDGYASVAGWRPTAEQLSWWEVYGTLRWVLLCRQQATVFLTGRDSLEHAVIGRRVCEAEFDLLLALGLVSPSTVADPLDTARQLPDRAPHDAPGADALLAAVARSLADGELGAAVPAGRSRFLSRVAANAVRIARRELLLGDELADAHRRRLAGLGVADDAELAARIRSGELDSATVAPAIVDTVRDKLRVANPAHLAAPA